MTLRGPGRAQMLALALGGAGGTLFFLAHLPLPWMLGAMSACTAAALSGLKPQVDRRLRGVMIAVLGVMLGSAFSPELIARVPGWSATLGVLFAAMAATTALVMAYLRRAGGMGPVTAYFAAAPGGVNEMVLAGAALGGDDRQIALIHALRILLIVFTVPFAFRLVTGIEGRSMGDSVGILADLGLSDAALLAICAGGGALVGRLVRLPAAGLTGPMLASAAIHLAGLTRSAPPAELVMVAQVVMGAGLGARFVGLTWAGVAATARVALGSTAIMVALSAGAALALASATGLPFAMLMLAFVPGGIAEMCLIALALGQDVAFVSTHHVLRVVMVIVAAPLAFRFIGRFWEGKT